jgi:PadR family transcriptional regulator PadR
MLILRVLRAGPSHGYAIAQRIRRLSGEVLEPEEGSLYPALQRMFKEGWVTAEWGVSETRRRVRYYTITKEGVQQFEREVSEYQQANAAINSVLAGAPRSAGNA